MSFLSDLMHSTFLGRQDDRRIMVAFKCVSTAISFETFLDIALVLFQRSGTCLSSLLVKGMGGH